MPHDVFISHSRAREDYKQIGIVIREIEADFLAFAGRPLAVFFDKTRCRNKSEWENGILPGLRESRLFLVFLSPAYLRCNYGRWEIDACLKKISARDCPGGCDQVFFLHPPRVCETNFGQRRADWMAGTHGHQKLDFRPWHEEGVQALQELAVADRMATLKVATRPLTLGNMGGPNPHFTGRVAKVRLLRSSLVKEDTGLTVINGLTGSGKTALAVQYAHAFADQYGGGCWQIACAGKTDLREAACQLAPALGVELAGEEMARLDRQFDGIIRALKNRAGAPDAARCLILLDDIDNAKFLNSKLLSRLIRGGRAHVVATTQLGRDELHAPRNCTFLSLDELSEDEAVALVESRQHGRKFSDDQERAAARGMVRLLGCFTAVVESAAVFLADSGITCASFLERLKWEGLEGFNLAVGGERQLGALLQPTLEHLSEAEKLVLTLSALLPGEQVPLPWLRALAAREFPELGEDGRHWPQLVRRLTGSRLFRTAPVHDPDGQPLVVRVHRIVQHLMLLECPARQRMSHQIALEKLVEERQAALKKITKWEEARWELEPLTALAGMWDEAKHSRAAWLMFQTAERWLHLAEWARAEPLMRRSLALSQENPAAAELDLAMHFNNLGQLLKETNRLAEAEDLMRKALALDEQNLEPTHVRVSCDLSNLALLLAETNRLAEAESLMRRSLEITEKEFGHYHQKAAVMLNNLSHILHAAGRLPEAESLIRRALAINEKEFGPQHPTVARNLNNLANQLLQTNELHEAESLLRRALAIDEDCFGEEHPAVAAPLINLASLLQKTARSPEAEPLLRRALAIDEKSFGQEHPKVARDLGNLALFLKTTHRLAEAERLLHRALAIHEQCSGPDHPSVAKCLNNLAGIFQARGLPAKAEPLLRRALAINEQSLGAEHNSVAGDLNNLAQLLKSTDRPDLAEPLMRRVISIFEKNLGPEHPKVALGLNNLGVLLGDTWRLDEAESLLRWALEIDEKSCGPQHPAVARDLNNLAAVLEKADRLTEAESLMRRAVEILLEFGRAARYPHPSLPGFLKRFQGLLRLLGCSEPEIAAKLTAIAPDSL